MRLGFFISAILWAGIAYALTGCGVVSMPSPLQDGHVMLTGDAKGVREFGRVFTGIANEAKTPGGTKGAYWQAEELREVEETKRHMRPGLLDGLFASRGGAQ